MLRLVTTCSAICYRFAAGGILWRRHGNRSGWPSALRCHNDDKKVLSTRTFKAHKGDELTNSELNNFN